MSKTKMRCITCGKWFQSANAREVTCPDCTQKARKEKLASKNTPPPANKVTGSGTQGTSTPPRPVAPPKPKTNKGGTNQWLDNLSDVKVGEPEPPPQRPKIPSPPVQRDRTDRENPGAYRTPHQNTNADNIRPYSDGPTHGPATYDTTAGQRPQIRRQPIGEGPNRGGYSGNGGHKPWQKNAAHGPLKPKPKQAKVSKPAAPPKPKREKIVPPEPFTPTAEQIKQVEERYLALAQPAEFDGIRSQIAKELSIPKKAVKKIVKELRDRQDIPSWWELQTYKGSTEEMERIKTAYQPFLPVPPVGVHKQIAETLELKPGTVYQAIKAIRTELNLPQYNDPTLHEQELAHLSRKQTKTGATATQEEERPGENSAEA